MPRIKEQIVEDTIEIAWDNTELYSEVKFNNPKGI
ncbi:hypothetical protein BJV85_003670 [Clostridium acetobutylicum]|nr:hypothetical protein [Clostridium acetobutylicum]NOW16322.1 hypothetical protein [Clostridium acetobutylicum]NRY58005.1 hypothetical protein [Clostridium acetobutylicum]NSA94747.1 hypothetical protein [Clostridium acetobutylicum]NYC95917.1 hypothetical protein [Clostridium acetobutylicum]